MTPYESVYHTGDTVWLRYRTDDKTSFDSLSNQRHSSAVVQYQFGASFLPNYQTPDNPTDGFCTFITPAGLPDRYVTNQSGTTTSFDITCNDAPNYDIEIGVVLTHTGIYVLDLPDGNFLEACSNQSNPYPNSVLHFTYNLPGSNKDVYLQIQPESRQETPAGYSETRIDSKVSYAIQVNP